MPKRRLELAIQPTVWQTAALTMHPLFSVGEYEIVESTEHGDGLMLLDRGREVCDISGECAERLMWLFLGMQNSTDQQWFTKEVNCHGLAEYVMGRRPKWRSKAKYIGEDAIPPDSPLPRDLPLVYQFMNPKGDAVHSGVVLGRQPGRDTVFTLEKLNSCELSVDTYRDNLRSWTTLICPAINQVRLRYPPPAQMARKAA